MSDHKFKVWDGDAIQQGEARDILERIRSRPGGTNEELREMNTEEYAKALIEDAPYFLDQALLKALATETYPSDYDRALVYLAAMPASRVRILS